MCGRYVLHAPVDEIRNHFEAEARPGNVAGEVVFGPDYNITPAQTVPVVARNGDGERAVVPMRWGLVPGWSKKGPSSRPLFNARSETVASKPSFRSAFRRRRALVPANGFYEWVRAENEDGDNEKLPYYIHDVERPLFAIAAIWDSWTPPDDEDARPLLSCSMLTMEADGAMAELHHRQPVRLPESQWEEWLRPRGNKEQVLEHFLPSDTLEFYRVDQAVNSGRASGAELMEPLEGETA